ncbi:MAG: hypothetical protein LBQ12_05680 [Deltaproteobacteria bacterium]|nr:hypothetical protein [Deltaproteobacteria bacterium]
MIIVWKILALPVFFEMELPTAKYFAPSSRWGPRSSARGTKYSIPSRAFSVR